MSNEKLTQDELKRILTNVTLIVEIQGRETAALLDAVAPLLGDKGEEMAIAMFERLIELRKIMAQLAMYFGADGEELVKLLNLGKEQVEQVPNGEHLH